MHLEHELVHQDPSTVSFKRYHFETFYKVSRDLRDFRDFFKKTEIYTIDVV